jgi:hypothetical protein
MKIINSVIYSGLDERKETEVKSIMDLVNEAVTLNKKFFEIGSFSFQIEFLSSREEINQKIGVKTPDWIVGWTKRAEKKVYILGPWAFEEESCHLKRRFAKVLNHEIAHLFTYQIYPFSVPVWLVEGLATYVAGQRPSNKIDRALLRTGILSRVGRSKEYFEKRKNQAYTLSYLWIDYLVTRFSKEKLLKFVIRLSNSGKEVEEIFKDNFGFTLRKTEKDFLKNVRKGGD